MVEILNNFLDVPAFKARVVLQMTRTNFELEY